MKKPKLVELTPEHIAKFSGEYFVPITGIAMVLDGEPIAIGGYADHGDALQLFSYITDTAKRYPLLLCKACYLILDWVDASKKKAFAFRDEDHPNSENFLAHLGLEPDGEVWRY
jgi:hypothetical protein